MSIDKLGVRQSARKSPKIPAGNGIKSRTLSAEIVNVLNESTVKPDALYTQSNRFKWRRDDFCRSLSVSAGLQFCRGKHG